MRETSSAFLLARKQNGQSLANRAPFKRVSSEMPQNVDSLMYH